jgi:hypothetical protein
MAYSFWQDLTKWCGDVYSPSSYDLGQWRTGAYLQDLGASVHSFSVHFPQVLNTHWAKSIYRTHAAALAQGMDEWSLYFNIAIEQYPQAFRLRSLRALRLTPTARFRFTQPREGAPCLEEFCHAPFRVL